LTELEGIIVGVLGQWASGKSTAAKALVGHLGGAGSVVFIDDRALLAGQAVRHILELGDSKVVSSIEDDGTRRLEGELATVYLSPGEDLDTVDLSTLLFDLHQVSDEDGVPAWCSWFQRARAELGHQILERSGDGKPVVIEAAFGTNTVPTGENPFCHAVSDLFTRLEGAGVAPNQVGWILVDAGYEIRSRRNQERPDTVRAIEFDRYAADGGDLDADDQKRWEELGTIIKRVPNKHDDIERFRADIIAAYEEMYGGV
jgi:ABC-type oligopeptide transport system ATPase subunit